MLDSSKLFDLTDWAFTSGPEEMRESMSSVVLQEMVEHSPDDIAEAFLSFPAMQLVHPAEPSWWEWKAKWEHDGRFIEIGFSLFDTVPNLWGGSELHGECLVGDVLALWAHLLSTHRGIWLHNSDCDMHTPQTFIEELDA